MWGASLSEAAKISKDVASSGPEGGHTHARKTSVTYVRVILLTYFVDVRSQAGDTDALDLGNEISGGILWQQPRMIFLPFLLLLPAALTASALVPYRPSGLLITILS